MPRRDHGKMKTTTLLLLLFRLSDGKCVCGLCSIPRVHLGKVEFLLCSVRFFILSWSSLASSMGGWWECVHIYFMDYALLWSADTVHVHTRTHTHIQMIVPIWIAESLPGLRLEYLIEYGKGGIASEMWMPFGTEVGVLRLFYFANLCW